MDYSKIAHRVDKSMIYGIFRPWIRNLIKERKVFMKVLLSE